MVLYVLYDKSSCRLLCGGAWGRQHTLNPDSRCPGGVQRPWWPGAGHHLFTTTSQLHSWECSQVLSFPCRCGDVGGLVLLLKEGTPQQKNGKETFFFLVYIIFLFWCWCWFNSFNASMQPPKKQLSPSGRWPINSSQFPKISWGSNIISASKNKHSTQKHDCNLFFGGIPNKKPSISRPVTGREAKILTTAVKGVFNVVQLLFLPKSWFSGKLPTKWKETNKYWRETCQFPMNHDYGRVKTMGIFMTKLHRTYPNPSPLAARRDSTSQVVFSETSEIPAKSTKLKASWRLRGMLVHFIWSNHSDRFPPNGGLVREMGPRLFQENPGWRNIIPFGQISCSLIWVKFPWEL